MSVWWEIIEICVSATGWGSFSPCRPFGFVLPYRNPSPCSWGICSSCSPSGFCPAGFALPLPCRSHPRLLIGGAGGCFPSRHCQAGMIFPLGSGVLCVQTHLSPVHPTLLTSAMMSTQRSQSRDLNLSGG